VGKVITDACVGDYYCVKFSDISAKNVPFFKKHIIILRSTYLRTGTCWTARSGGLEESNLGTFRIDVK
jgi:hypothetical protein